MASIEETMKDVLIRYVRAAFERRFDELADLEHDRATFAYQGGVRMTHQEHVKALATASRLHEHDLTDFRCEAFGDDTVVVWFDHTLRVELAEDPFDNPVNRRQFAEGSLYAVTTVWHRTGADWSIICMDDSWVESGYVPREQRDKPNVWTYPDLDPADQNRPTSTTVAPVS